MTRTSVRLLWSVFRVRPSQSVASLCAVVAAAGLVHCGPAAPTTGSTGGNRPPLVIKAEILPNPIVLTGPVTVQIDAEDPERESVSFRYRWFLNGSELPGQTSSSLSPEVLKRGQELGVEIIPSDGSQEGKPYRTPIVRVANTPPIVSRVLLTPNNPVAGEKISAQVSATDPDNDTVLLNYRWFKDSTLVKEGENESFLDTEGSAGKTVVLEVVPRDFAVAGNSVSSHPVSIGNSPPKIVSMPPVAGGSERYEYRVRAEDRDGDTVTYRLETGPPGMIIDSLTGQLLWSIPSDWHATVHVKILATDGQGGEAFQEFELVAAPALPAKSSGT